MRKENEEKIDAYLLGQLTDQEMNSIQLRRLEDAKFNKQFEEQELANLAIELAGRKDLRQRLTEIHKRGGYDLPSNNNRKLSLIFGVILLLLGLLTLLYNHFNQTNEKLYLAYFEPYAYNGNERSETETSIFELADLYRQRKYTEFVDASKTVLDDNTLRSEFLLALGVANLDLGEEDEALKVFKSINSMEDFHFKDEIQWYMALTYLRKGSLAEALKLLEEINLDENHDHYEEANSLIQKVQNLK